MNDKIQIELSVADALELATLLQANADLAKDKLLEAPTLVNFILRMADEIRNQLSEKATLEEIKKAIKINSEQND